MIAYLVMAIDLCFPNKLHYLMASCFHLTNCDHLHPAVQILCCFFTVATMATPLHSGQIAEREKVKISSRDVCFFFFNFQIFHGTHIWQA